MAGIKLRPFPELSVIVTRRDAERLRRLATENKPGQSLIAPFQGPTIPQAFSPCRLVGKEGNRGMWAKSSDARGNLGECTESQQPNSTLVEFSDAAVRARIPSHHAELPRDSFVEETRHNPGCGYRCVCFD